MTRRINTGKKNAVKQQDANPVGRPRVLFDNEETLEKLKVIASGQHTQPEAAAILGVSTSTFEKFLRASEKAREIWDAGESNGKASLRRAQWVKAVKEGNTTMQIWLGKQYLGQKDQNHLVNQHELGGSFRELWAALGRAGVKDGA